MPKMKTLNDVSKKFFSNGKIKPLGGSDKVKSIFDDMKPLVKNKTTVMKTQFGTPIKLPDVNIKLPKSPTKFKQNEFKPVKPGINLGSW
jgi:hypothetical protein